MKPRLANHELPRKRITSIVERVSQTPTRQIAAVGILLYIVPVVVFTVIDISFLLAGQPLVYAGNQPAHWMDLLYFNLITIITIGYGDLHPVGFGRAFSVIEGILGVGIFGFLVAALTAKFLSPRSNSVIFSRYAYYCTDEERFLLIFVNTTNTYMVNVDMTSYFKLGGNWGVRESIRTPLITTSVQAFHLDKEPLKNIIQRLQEDDVFRFGLSGAIGISSYSTAVEYYTNDIIVIPNRDELTGYEGFISPDFRSVDISSMFHYRPANSLTLAEYVAYKRGARA